MRIASYDEERRFRRPDGQRRGSTLVTKTMRLEQTNMSEKDLSANNSRSEHRQPPPSVASEHREPPSVAEDSVEAKKLADRAKKVSDDDDLPA